MFLTGTNVDVVCRLIYSFDFVYKSYVVYCEDESKLPRNIQNQSHIVIMRTFRNNFNFIMLMCLTYVDRVGGNWCVRRMPTTSGENWTHNIRGERRLYHPNNAHILLLYYYYLSV